jgi:hypothetical protein
MPRTSSEKMRQRGQSEERITGELPSSLASLISAVSNSVSAPAQQRLRAEVQYVSPQLQLLPPFVCI